LTLPSPLGQFIRPQAELPKDRPRRSGWQFAASGGTERPLTAQLDANVTAFAAACFYRRAESAQFAEKLVLGHGDRYTLTRINPAA